MPNFRDDFPKSVIEALAKRAAYLLKSGLPRPNLGTL